MLGNIDIHIDNASLSSTSNFIDIVMGCGMQQLVTGRTHRAGRTLDVVVHNTTSATVVVEPPVISDHSVIIVTVDLVFARETVIVTKRDWSKLKVEEL